MMMEVPQIFFCQRESFEKGKTKPCIQIGMKNYVRKVTAADHLIIPPLSEAVIDVFIERKESDDVF
ncbi:hypothetical protein DPMN_000319 [Dreissena polymorpha]|uniref:Uncharacterized protein n=1 Tax=Dreissena polymorpha TaxID=45954 RepID=A0A9D4MHX5_DREPO|nr:hypothetical protein DPMN_000319 [Dreissena polymorpha]